MWVANAKATHIFFSKNISVYAIFNNQSFNNNLTNDIVCFKLLGPNYYGYYSVFNGLIDLHVSNMCTMFQHNIY